MGAHTDSSSTLEGDVGGDLNARGSLGYLAMSQKTNKSGMFNLFFFSLLLLACV